MNWHTLDKAAIFIQTGSGPTGLTEATAGQKLQQLGYNRVVTQKRRSPLALFLLQFKDFMIGVLLVAAIVSAFTGDTTDAIIILVIVLLNALIGFFQEYKAERVMEALKQLATPLCNVLREDRVVPIDSEMLVVGDVVLLEAGNTVPADLRLIKVQGLKIMESSLTGESISIDKISAVLEDAALPTADRLNMAYKGTDVTNGRGKGIVVATGMQTEIGKIAQLLQTAETATPLQQRMQAFGKKLSYIILALCAVLFGVGLLRGEAPLHMLLLSLSLAVAAIPEALPALITLALARGASRLAKKNALIRRLTAVETLGAVTVICTDKTGTLTQNKMTVTDLRPAPESMVLAENIPVLHLAMALNHTVTENAEGLVGDPTETALVDFVLKTYGHEKYDYLRAIFALVEELPFDAERKCMTTIHRFGEKLLVVTKGATESVVSRLITTENAAPILAEANTLAAEGKRVLAYGYRLMNSLPEKFHFADIEMEILFAGLVSLIDPPREEVTAAVAECRTAGIRPVMITGDHIETAVAIAKQIGLMPAGAEAVNGTTLQNLSAEDWKQNVANISVYARVSPEQKLHIVTVLQEAGHFVAMTGDGVNDAPSLRRANIGVAMGITGTDVSKEAAQMILLDDNFSTIVKAVREGRRVYDNIRRFVKYVMTCNSAEIWTIFLAPLLGLPLPLLPIHILWINLVTDGLPGLALSAEKEEPGIMQRPPRPPKESLFAEGIGVHILWVGLLMAFLTLASQALAIRMEIMHWQTIVFTILSLSQLAHAFAIRSDRVFIYRKGFFSNPALLLAVVFTFLLQLAVIYLPLGNRLFQTAPLSLFELLACMGVAALVFHAVEGEKWWKERRSKG